MGLVEHINSNIDLYKLLVPIVATFIVSIIGLYISSSYNSKQIEINKRQNENNRRMAIIKEVSSLLPKLGSKNETERKFASMTLGFYDKETLPVLKVLLFDSNPSIQISAAEALLMHNNIESFSYLKETIDNEWHVFSTDNKSKILLLLTKLRKSNALEVVEQRLNDVEEDYSVKQTAIRCLIYFEKNTALSLSQQVLDNKKNENIQVRIEAAKSIEHFRDPGSIEILEKTLERSLAFIQHHQAPKDLDIPQTNYEKRLILNELKLMEHVTDGIKSILESYDFSRYNDILANFFPEGHRIFTADPSFRTMFLRLVDKWNLKSPEVVMKGLAENPESKDETKESAKRIIEIFEKDTMMAPSWRGLKYE